VGDRGDLPSRRKKSVGATRNNRLLFTLRPSLGFSYIGSVTARNSSSGRQPKFAASHKEWNYGTFADGATYMRLGGHHVGHRPHILVSYKILPVILVGLC